MNIATNAYDVANQVKAYTSSVKSKINLFLEKITDEGIKVARARFPSGYVEKEKIADGVVIYTTKEDAVFIEFGAGWGATHPLAFEFDFGIGSWSEEHSRMFIEKHYWVHTDENGNKVTYDRIPAQMGMYNASKYMKQIVVRVAREVFND